MDGIDVLIVTALKEEHDAAAEVALAGYANNPGVDSWELRDSDTATPYSAGAYRTSSGAEIALALARSTRMGPNSTIPVASALAERLRPKCLAMCGVCAGNPTAVALGDVIVAELAYAYDEGKRTREEFEADHRQIPLSDAWVRGAQELTPVDLASHGEVSQEEARSWVLERLYLGEDPKDHPARSRYLPGAAWPECLGALESRGLMTRSAATLTLTEAGRTLIARSMYDMVTAPSKLPFRIVVGPMASGNVVVKDDVTWNQLRKWGVRTVVGLDMEAAAIASVAHRLGVLEWVVAKGVMDHANPRKDDRYKPFAARASAEVLFKFLVSRMGPGNSRHKDDRIRPVVYGNEFHELAPFLRSLAPKGFVDDREYTVSDLYTHDVLRVARAARALAAESPDVALIIRSGRGDELAERSARHVLAAAPERSAELILEAIRDTPVAGPGWHRASWAGDLASPALGSYAAAELGSGLQNWNVEVQRHAITALGRMAASSWSGEVTRLAARDPDKLGSYACEALARTFRDAADSYFASITASYLADFLRTHLKEDWLSDVRHILRRLSPSREQTLREWLDSEDQFLVQLSADALGHMRLDRARRPMSDRQLRGDLPAEVQEDILRALGMVGGAEAVQMLVSRVRRTRGRMSPAQKPAMSALAMCLQDATSDKQYRSLLDDLLQSDRVNDRLFACRSIGLRPYPSAAVSLETMLHDPSPPVRGAAALAGARLDTLDASRLEYTRAQASGGDETLFATLALLLATRDQSLINALSTLMADRQMAVWHHPLLAEDVLTTLEESGGDSGAELSAAIRWFRTLD